MNAGVDTGSMGPTAHGDQDLEGAQLAGACRHAGDRSTVLQAVVLCSPKDTVLGIGQT